MCVYTYIQICICMAPLVRSSSGNRSRFGGLPTEPLRLIDIARQRLLTGSYQGITENILRDCMTTLGNKGRYFKGLYDNPRE